MTGFTKLFSQILDSTIWDEPWEVKGVWITLLAMADSKGRIMASIPGLARRSTVTLEQAEKAIELFLSPDKYSRTPDHDGRRLEVIEGGWRLLNYQKYREMRDEDSRKEYQREWDRTKRVRQKVSESDTIRPNPTQAEAEAEADTDKEKDSPAPSPSAPAPELSSTGKPKKGRKSKLETTGLRPEFLEAFQALWETFPREGPRRWDGEAQKWISERLSPGSRFQAEKNFQRIIDNGIATGRQLYLSFYAYVHEEPKVEKGFVQQVSTFFGPEKATYLEWLERGKQIERENYPEVG